jgi:AcrR family transcriptional regulator
MGRPPGVDSAETRTRIVAATMRTVAEVGYSRATIRAIASAADMTSGSLYHYFPNKAELVTAAFHELADVSVQRMAAAAQRPGTPIEKLLALLDEGSELVRDYPYASAFDRALRVESPPDLHLVESSDSIFASLQAVVVGIVKQAKRDGQLNASVTTRAAAAAVNGLLQAMYELGASDPSQHRATVNALELLLRGELFPS